MYNNWFRIGPLTVHGYGAMVAAGIMTAVHGAEKRAKEESMKVDGDFVSGLVFWCVLIGLAGAKLLYVLVSWQEFLKDPRAVLGSTGYVLYGGLVSGTLAAAVYCRKRQIDFRRYFAMFCPYIALAQGFGRIGCFLAGCCYGRPTSLAIGVVFPEGSFAPAGQKLLPVQLFSSAADFSLYALLDSRWKRRRHPEANGALFLMLYSSGRFLMEFLRGDVRGSVGALSTSQFLSLFVLAAGIWMLHQARKPKPAAAL
jgi:phosphatidylglycerol:prolipoprotein diacylglycerol transferase